MMSTLTPIGFHASYAIDDQGKKTSDAAQGARIGAYLTGLGFNSKVVTFAVSAGAKEMRWLQKGMAERLGIAVASSTPAQRRLAYESFTTGLKARAASMPAYEDAARLYRQSADLGFAGAQNNLGDMYEAGQGVPKSEKAAIHWYTRAAERGEPTAYLSLASLLRNSGESAAFVLWANDHPCQP